MLVLQAVAEQQLHLPRDHVGSRFVVVVVMRARAGARRQARELQAQAGRAGARGRDPGGVGDAGAPCAGAPAGTRTHALVCASILPMGAYILPLGR